MHDTCNAAFRHYFAIFIIALATIAYQIVLTRLLSVKLYYHFAFAGITLAMLGLTQGAIRVFTRAATFTIERCDEQIARHAVSCAIAMALATALHLCYPLNAWTEGVALFASLFVGLCAFTDSGVCTTLLLTRFPLSASRLYAFDLVGAAAGSVLVILCLKTLDPVSMVFLLSTVIAIAAWQIIPASAPTQQHRLTAAVVLLLASAAALQSSAYLAGRNVFTLDVGKNAFHEPPDFERWNTYSRIAVSPASEGPPFGWGFGSDHTDVRVRQRLLTIDADASTVLTEWRGDVTEVSYLKDDIVNLGYHIRQPTDIAIIGVGGGRDILSALVFGAKQIDGIELNPAVIETLTTRFAAFTGYLSRRPQVHLRNAEARSFINQSVHHYDLIQVSLTDTWAATAAGGFTLSENKLYTVQAWQEFLAKLRKNGTLTVSRWVAPGAHEGEFYRLLALGAEALQCEGIPPEELRRHMLAATVGGIVTVALSKTPFDEVELARFEEATRTHHYTTLLSPTVAYDDNAAQIASGRATAEFFRSLPVDVSPPTDDRPFFFHMARLVTCLTCLLRGDLTHSMNFKNDFASLVLAITLVTALLCTGFLVILPLWKVVPLNKGVTALPSLLYFACIGLGFMLIEVSQMQRLMIFLGHPVYGLSVVLFTLLLSAGLGSYTVGPAQAPRQAWIRPAMLCLLLLAAGLATPVLIEKARDSDTGFRIFLSAVLIAPSGLIMGMMFPLGVALSRMGFPGMLPWFWGVNGAMSVLASVGGIALSMQYGISHTYWVGLACYAGCLPLTHLLSRSGTGRAQECS